MKISSEWVRWCKANGLVTSCPNKYYHGGKRKRSNWLCLKGKGFVWRINCYGMFQRGDKTEDFDRWALCNIDEVVCPNSKSEFDAAVKFLMQTYNPENNL